MGDHTKIVPKKITTTSGKHILRETDLFIELLLGDEKLSIEGITDPSILNQVCRIKSFEVKEFDEELVVLWQIAEGLMGRGQIWSFGYDEKNVREAMLKNICNKFLDRILENKKSATIIVSIESGELVYREVIKNN